MGGVEIRRPGREDWETAADLGGRVPLADVVGSLVRYPSGVVLRVTGLTDPDAGGVRHLLMEVNSAAAAGEARGRSPRPSAIGPAVASSSPG